MVFNQTWCSKRATKYSSPYVGPKVSPTWYGSKFCLTASRKGIRCCDRDEEMDSRGQASPYSLETSHVVRNVFLYDSDRHIKCYQCLTTRSRRGIHYPENNCYYKEQSSFSLHPRRIQTFCTINRTSICPTKHCYLAGHIEWVMGMHFIALDR